MPRIPPVMGLVIVLAAGSCNPESCLDKCQSHVVTKSAEDLLPNQELATTVTCSSKCHAKVTFTWSVAIPVVIFGDVVLKAQISCGGETMPASETRAKASARSVQLEPTNAKNICGEDAPEAYAIVLTNDANDVLVNPKMSMNCPTLSAGPVNFTGPSAVRVGR